MRARRAAIGALLAACSGNALAMGFSHSPGDAVMFFVLSLPVLAGLLAGAFTGWKWRLWTTLPIGGAVMLGLLLLVFTRERWDFYAWVAVPILLGAYVASHLLGHFVSRLWSRRRRRSGGLPEVGGR